MHAPTNAASQPQPSWMTAPRGVLPQQQQRQNSQHAPQAMPTTVYVAAVGPDGTTAYVPVIMQTVTTQPPPPGYGLQQSLYAANTTAAVATTTAQPRSTATKDTAPRRVKASKQHLVKSKLCRHFNRSVGCRNGAACPFAHGDDELRASVATATASTYPQHHSRQSQSPPQATPPTRPVSDSGESPEVGPMSQEERASRASSVEPLLAALSPSSQPTPHGAAPVTNASMSDEDTYHRLTALQLPSLDDFSTMTLCPPLATATKARGDSDDEPLIDDALANAVAGAVLGDM